MGCDYYISENLCVEYIFKGIQYQNKLHIDTHKRWFRDYTEEEIEQVLKPRPDKPTKLSEYTMRLIKVKILESHDFNYPNKNFFPENPEITDQDIDSFNKISSFLNLGKEVTIGAINSKINRINIEKLIELNYLNDVEITSTVIKTSAWLRN